MQNLSDLDAGKSQQIKMLGLFSHENFEFEIESSDFKFIQRFNTLFEQRAQLVSENIRLEQEVQDLRNLEIVNQELQLQLESYEAISTVSNIQNFELAI